MIGLKPRCGNCGDSYGKHVKGRACDNYQPRQGLADKSDKQIGDEAIWKEMRTAHLAFQHEFYGGSQCEATAAGIKHICQGALQLDHVNLKKNLADRFSMSNTQMLCENANLYIKGSKRTDYRTEAYKKALSVRFPGIWPSLLEEKHGRD